MAQADIDAIRTALGEGDFTTAEHRARAALQRDPEDALIHAWLGSILMHGDGIELALEHYRTAVRLRPATAELRNELGNALAVAGRLAEAEAELTEAARLAPGIAQIHNNLGNVLRAAGRHADAGACYRAAIERKPDYAEAMANLGVALQETGDLDAAADCYRRALKLDPGAALATTHLGTVLAARGKLAEAEAAHRAAIAAAPGLHGPYNNLGIVLKDQGRLAEAAAAYREALQRRPGDASIHSNLLMAMCYDPRADEPRLYAAHVAFGEKQETSPRPDFAVDRDPARVLRVGYVSPDLYSHSVAAFFGPVLRHHDRSQVHVTCYSDLVSGDEVTDRLRALADGWRDVAGLSDAALVETIRADAIDILVDLAGHTAGNRLPAFAARAAPLQVTWIGYPATTGLGRMDWRISDRWVDPPGVGDRWHTERLLRLDAGFLCYQAPDDAPVPRASPSAGGPVFGSFNNLSKVNGGVIEVWAELLRAEPAARLLLKSRQLADDGVRARIVDAFARRSIAADRLDLRGRIASREAHLAAYREVDVALDTFPYNGTATTCEAMWMGVPVVTLAGARHAARVGASLLHRAGRADWIAHAATDYVAIARRLAAARPAPEEVREALRRSALMDAAGFTRELDGALRRIWRDWCGTPPATGP